MGRPTCIKQLQIFAFFHQKQGRSLAVSIVWGSQLIYVAPLIECTAQMSTQNGAIGIRPRCGRGGAVAFG